MRRTLIPVLVALSLALAACGGGSGSPESAARRSATTASTVATVASTVPATTTTTLPKPRYTVATAKSTVTEVPIYDAPNAAQATRSLPNPEPYYGTLRVFLVQNQEGDWLYCFLPMRPNGTQGWIRLQDVDISQHDYHMVVDVENHQLTAYDRDDVVLQTPIGLGKSTTPTPGGLFYTTFLWKGDGSQPEYGPFAFGMSGYSEVIYSFGAGDGQFAIHGTNDPSSVGRSVSNGCIRMNNDAITQLAQTLPPSGVPVEIK